MNRTIGGLPVLYWIVGLAAGIGAFAWIKKRSSSSSSPAAGAAAKTPSFTQAQEVQDFQIFSALTGAQQASDLNFLTEVAGLFSGGSSTGTPGGAVTGSGGGGGSTIAPAPPSTGTTSPTTVPASTVPPGASFGPGPGGRPQANSAPSAAAQPGYGAGVGELLALNPGLASGAPTPGITGYTVSYNGVPI